MASRMFNAQQALEREVKEVFAKVTFGTPTAPTATINTTEPIILTHALKGSYLSGRTVTIQVAAAADNPTDTVLADVTGTASAIVVTITPNDGTNNSATPVPLTTEELAELLDSGSVVGKTVTVTDTGSLLAQIASAAGGDSTDLADSGEGDGEVATWSGGEDDLSESSVLGIASIARNEAGDFTLTLDDKWPSLKAMKAIHLATSAADLNVQMHSETVSTDKQIRFFTLAGATKTDPADGTLMFIKLELKNSSTVA